MTRPRLVVFAGLPGSGKSAVADGVGRALGVPVLSVDPIEEAMHAAGIPASFERGVAAYLVAARSARHILDLGQRVIVEAVNAEPEGRAVWTDLAVRCDVDPMWVHVVCSDPALHRSRLEGRTPGHPGIDEPTWEAVRARAAGYADWADERLELDTVAPLAQTVARAVAALG